VGCGGGVVSIFLVGVFGFVICLHGLFWVCFFFGVSAVLFVQVQIRRPAFRAAHPPSTSAGSTRIGCLAYSRYFPAPSMRHSGSITIPILACVPHPRCVSCVSTPPERVWVFKGQRHWQRLKGTRRPPRPRRFPPSCPRRRPWLVPSRGAHRTAPKCRAWAPA